MRVYARRLVVISTAHEFSKAVRAHRFERVALDAAALAVASESLAETGLLLVGEPHGVYETPAVLYAIIDALDVRAVALEWSHDELGGHVDRSLANGSLEFDEYWALPPSAEFFAGDGRITAGHFALLERLRAEDRLDQLILYDRLDPEPPPEWHVRDREMAERLLATWDDRHPLLVLTGAFHAQTTPLADGEPMGHHLANTRSRLAPAMLDYSAGQCWSRGATHDVSGPMPSSPITMRLTQATPAVVPGRRATADMG
jgi:hypothetical protein